MRNQSMQEQQVYQKDNIIYVNGDVTFNTVMKLQKLGDGLIQKSDSQSVIDFSSVTKCDSSALTLLLAWIRYAKQQKKALQFSQLPESILAVAKLCGIVNFLPIEK